MPGGFRKQWRAASTDCDALPRGADVGGTFTDVALYDAQTQRLTLHKRLTTPDDPRRAIVDGLNALPARAEIVTHGTTLVANALIERRGVPTGLLTTDGYRDVLEIGNELRYDTFDLQLERPPPLVDRPLRLPVRERIGADGSIALPLDEDNVRAAANALLHAGVRSVAVAFFNSCRNAAHELRAKAIVAALNSEIAVCASAEIAPANTSASPPASRTPTSRRSRRATCANCNARWKARSSSCSPTAASRRRAR
jgi:N-methylhydantoinase A/oxoprolinase/acetone carboxylase beta subunit